MSKWAHSDVLDNGPAYIKANCNSLAAILAYTLADSYATVTGGGNIIAQTALASGDFLLTDGASGARTLILATGKQDAAADVTADPTHFAFLDTTNSKVLWVTTETSAQTVTAGNPVTFPPLSYISQQPV